ncbi:MAG TPA: hypothetical protein VIY73_07580 [Polyangiaceae bacterium]
METATVRSLIAVWLLACAGVSTGGCKSREEQLREQQARIADEQARTALSAAASNQAAYERRESALAAESARTDQELLLERVKHDVGDLTSAILVAEKTGGPDAGRAVLAERHAHVADELARAREARAMLMDFDAGEFPGGERRVAEFRRAIVELDELSTGDADIVCGTSNGTKAPARAATAAKLCDEFRSLLGVTDAGR